MFYFCVVKCLIGPLLDVLESLRRNTFFQDGNKLKFNDKIGLITKWGGVILASRI